MKKRTGCEYESAIVKSVKTRTATVETSAHLETCADCRETAKIVRLFQTDLIAQSMPKAIPAAGLIWWKSEIKTKRLRAERAAAPIFFVQAAAAALIVATLAWLALNLQSSFFDAPFNRLFESMEQIMAYLVTGAVGFTLVCTALVLGLRRFLLEK